MGVGPARYVRVRMQPRTSSWALHVAGPGFIGLVAGVDYISGELVGLSLFYLVPVLFAGWRMSAATATTWAVAAAVAWFSCDYAFHGPEHPYASMWNGFTRLIIYVTAGQLVALVRKERAALIAANAKLAGLLALEGDLSRTDSLTGLANTRAFLERLEEELARARRTGLPLCVAYLDLDHFKRVNDQLGHAAGDDLLRKVGHIFRDIIRTEDVLARLGGDEFGFIFAETRREVVEQLASRLVEAVRALDAGPPQSPVGASVGLAFFERPPLSAEYALRIADDAMYEAKGAGRNAWRLRLGDDALAENR